MDSEKPGGVAGLPRQDHPYGSTSSDPKSAVWIRKKGVTVKIVEGTSQAAIDRMVDQAIAAAERVETPLRRESLPTVMRLTSLLADRGPLTGAAIAAELGLSHDAVRKALSRAAGSKVVMRPGTDGAPATWELKHEDVGARYLASIEGRDQ